MAIKVVSETFTHDPERVARFHGEAQLLAALNHPHVATIHGLEETAPSTSSGQAGRHFLVMELVEGETLAERLKSGPIPVAEALRIARQVADALQAAHEYDIAPDGRFLIIRSGQAEAGAGTASIELDPPSGLP